MLGVPFVWVLYSGLQPSVWSIATLRVALVENLSLLVKIQHRFGGMPQGSVGHRFPVGIVEHCRDAVALSLLVAADAEFRVDHEFRIPIIIINKRAHSKVGYAYLRRGKEGYATVYSGDAPHVLVFEIAAV